MRLEYARAAPTASPPRRGGMFIEHRTPATIPPRRGGTYPFCCIAINMSSHRPIGRYLINRKIYLMV
jgi:hypothetical protein